MAFVTRSWPISALWNCGTTSEVVGKLHSLRVSKLKLNRVLYHHSYFWRNRNGAEIDYLELANDQLSAYEIKWNPKKQGSFRAFLNLYPEALTETVTPENYFLHLN
jgi:hypothetical protein